MNRFGAFAVHLGISLVIFLILGYLILFHWYPDFFFTSDGGWQGIRIVAAVDLVLGPMLTLVVFNTSKPRKELSRDLSIIAAIQLTCLTAGTYVVYSERPIAMVFADGSFYSLSADDYVGSKQPIPDLSSFGDHSPRWVTVKLPDDPIRQSDIRREALQSDVPIRVLQTYYQPFTVSDIELDEQGYSADDLRAAPGMTETLSRFELRTGTEIDGWKFIRFNTRYGFSLIAVNLETRQLEYLRLPQQREDEN